MTMVMPAATVSGPRGLRNVLGRRQLYRYPATAPRLGYLGIVVLITIMLYYLYYEEGALTPLMLPYYHMSFQYFIYLLVVSNAIGAFSALVGGLSDRIGRANFDDLRHIGCRGGAAGHHGHPFQVWFRHGLLRHRIRGRNHPRFDSSAHA